MLRGIILDFDGVIANTEPLHLRAYQAVFADLDLTLTESDYYGRYLGFDDVGVFEAMGHQHGLKLDRARIDTLIRSKSTHYDALVARLDVLFPGVVEAIERLAGAAQLAIASGALRGEIEAILRRANLLRHFPVIVAAGETPRSKPAPDPYRRAVDLLTALAPATGPPDPGGFIAVEDSPWGIESAVAAGLPCVAVTQTYDASRLGGARLVVSSLAGLTVDALQRLVR